MSEPYVKLLIGRYAPTTFWDLKAAEAGASHCVTWNQTEEGTDILSIDEAIRKLQELRSR